MSKSILVTGGNSGIGLALCKLLATQHGCHVFLGSRSEQRGKDAAKFIEEAVAAGCANAGRVECVQLDITSDASVQAAVDTIKSKTGGSPLYAVVNNAGTGFSHGASPEVIMNTNLYGTKRVCDAFIDMVNPNEGRIVNVGSGAGPIYARGCDIDTQKKLSDPHVEWSWIEEHSKTGIGSEADTFGGYGVSKALVSCYTAWLARQHPSIIFSCVTPGLIDTPLTAGFDVKKKSPEEGAVPLLHCLFEKLEGSGWYYGSDCRRSPLHVPRDPGEPAFDGKLPF